MKIFLKENNNQWPKDVSILKDKLTKKLLSEKDIHGIEHHLSPSTLEKLKKVNKFLKNKKFKS